MSCFKASYYNCQIQFLWHLQNITPGHHHRTYCSWFVLAAAAYYAPCSLSEEKFLLGRPSLQWFNCHLPDSGRQVTSLCQGVSSLAPRGGEMKEPGNMFVTMHYLFSPQVLLLFQKEKEEETASCKTQIIPPLPKHLDYIRDSVV